MTHELPTETLILHALRVAGWLGPDRLPAWGVESPQQTLDRLTEAGTLRLVRSPRGEMYGLTADGTERATALLTEWLATLDASGRAELTRALGGFEDHDGALKQLVTAYQAGGRDVVGQRLRDFHERARDALDTVASAAPFWRTYPARLASALLKTEKGELDWVASPLCDSYHTVWHLAHRDMRLICDTPPH